MDRMDFYNDEIKKGGDSSLYASDASIEAEAGFTKAADLAGATELAAASVSMNHVVLVDENDQPIVDPERIKAALAAQNLGAQTPDASTLIAQLKNRIIPAQQAAIEAEANLQLNATIPAQRALEFANQPPTPFGAGALPIGQGTNGAVPTGGTAGIGFGQNLAVDPQAIASFNQYRSVAQSAIDAVSAKAREGKQALLDMGVPQSTITEIEDLGNQAQGIELGIANEQAAFQAFQYNRQLFVMKRNLADAVELTGHHADANGRLGRIQRENFELGKKQNALQIESQELSIALSQRQINFQRAVAGFSAPGETPEERAARIHEAKIEADYAQRQLNIQRELLGLGKKQFVLGVRLFDETAQRQVSDLKFALAELGHAHALQLDSAAAQQAIAAIRARQAQLNTEIGVQIEKSVKRASLAINSALEISQKSGEAFATIIGQTADAWSSFVTQGAVAIRKLLHVPNALGGQSGGLSPDERSGFASGVIGDTLGPTSITIGEAGTEKVAVLKNPRTVNISALAAVAPSGGGGPSITVIVTGNKVSDEADENRLAARIAAQVENTLMRKTSLFGLRRV
jgi:hypothetical protein